jgi:hypothetical protein
MSFPVTDQRSLGRRISYLRLPAQDVPGVDASCRKLLETLVMSFRGCATTNDYQAFGFGWCTGLFGFVFFSSADANRAFLKSYKKPLDACALLCSI